MGASQLFILDVSDGAVAGLLCETDKRSMVPLASSFVNPGPGQEIFDAVEQVITKSGASSCDCRLALPASLFHFKNLALPFTDRRKIHETVRYELQDLISFGDEPFAYDTVVIDSEGTTTRLLAAVIKESEISPWLEILSGHGLAVEMITVSPLIRMTQYLHSAEWHGGTLLYLDAGQNESCLICNVDGAVTAIRMLPGLSEDSGGQLVDELLRTLLILGARDGDIANASLMIGGGAADELGVDLFAEQKEFSTVEIIDSTALGLSNNQAMQMLPVYLDPRLRGLGTLSPDQSGQFNMVREKVAQPASLSVVKKYAPILLLLLGLVGLVAGYQVFEYRNMVSERDRLAEEAVRIFSQTMDGRAPVADPVAEIRARISEIDQSVVASIVEHPELSSVALLSDISKRMPGSVRVSFKRFSFDRKKIMLDGVTDAYNDVDLIKKSLEDSPLYQAVSIDSAGSGMDGGGVRFSLTLLL